ncbi:hypothetical protein BKP64_05200 [Marinobacter salinus]|uniref:Sulfurtransferase TusB n=1 Tax=Marinobacter salinus TaxID=1874317 RepID=A0A1D9GJF7_9GAMM|nr:sulfurtransferase complex subunit TusB [Marinobacter salinus]AOY87615.1 hypothetical protein BKP64_05200 [Marinobacter salinus]
MKTFHTLHILNKPPGHPRFEVCQSMLGADDALLLTENGTLALTVSDIMKTDQVYALGADVSARGMDQGQTAVSLIGYEEMVALTLQAQQVISW